MNTQTVLGTHPILAIATQVANEQIQAAEAAHQAAKANLEAAAKAEHIAHIRLNGTHKVARAAISLAIAEAHAAQAREALEAVSAQVAAEIAEAEGTQAAPAEAPVNRIKEQLAEVEAKTAPEPSANGHCATYTAKGVVSAIVESAICKMTKDANSGVLNKRQAKTFLSKIGLTLEPMDLDYLTLSDGSLFHFELTSDGSLSWKIGNEYGQTI